MLCSQCHNRPVQNPQTIHGVQDLLSTYAAVGIMEYFDISMAL